MKQIVLEFYRCKKDILRNPEPFRDVFIQFFHKNDLFIVDEIFHFFQSYGNSGFVLSPVFDIAVHSLSDRQTVVVNVHSADSNLPIVDYASQIRKLLGASSYSMIEMKCGILRSDPEPPAV